MNLQYWRDPQKISRRVAREVVELADYDIEIHHLKGRENGRADALSRRLDYDQGEGDNENVVVLPDHVFAKVAELSGEDRQDEDVLRPWVDPHQLKRIDGLWTKQGRRVVTGGYAETRRILQSFHDPPVYGHPGISCTIDLVERHYWWPGL